MTKKNDYRTQDMKFRYRSAYPMVEFNLVKLLVHNRSKIFSPSLANRGRKEMAIYLQQDLQKKMQGDDSADVWTALKIYNRPITQEQADSIAKNQLPGYIFHFPVFDVPPPPEFCAKASLCIDFSMTVAVIARTTGSFYRAAQPPNYKLNHFLNTSFICNDSRIPEDCFFQESSNTL
ncbi:MAG: hypothetical protein KAH38_02080 [Candidatus Hydrogenedentes bacterium]|nr:hypothetical protein [Candidatus Hydrogenedentota bacterium]